MKTFVLTYHTEDEKESFIRIVRAPDYADAAALGDEATKPGEKRIGEPYLLDSTGPKWRGVLVEYRLRNDEYHRHPLISMGIQDLIISMIKTFGEENVKAILMSMAYAKGDKISVSVKRTVVNTFDIEPGKE